MNSTAVFATSYCGPRPCWRRPLERPGYHLYSINLTPSDPPPREQHAQPRVDDVVNHLLGHRELSQLGRAPDGKRQVMLRRPGPGDLLDLTPLRRRELRRAATAVLRVQRPYEARPRGMKQPGGDH
jgi:hypothetical protein